MTDETEEPETEEETTEPDVEIELSPGDSLNLEELYEKFGEDLIEADLEEVVKQRVRSLYDNQQTIEQQLAQAAQQQQPPQGPPR